MGTNLDQFRAGTRTRNQFLGSALWLALDKPELAPAQEAEWEIDVERLKGDAEEIAAAIEWAVRVDPEWTKYIRRMKNVADNLDRILRDFRAEQRSKRNTEAAASGKPISPSCQKLKAKWPGQLLQSILDLETKERVEARGQEYKTVCKVCKGKQSILNPYSKKNKNLKGVLGPCSACEAYKASIWDETKRQVRQELYA